MASVFIDLNNISYNIDIIGSLTESSYSDSITKNHIKKIFIGTNVTSIGIGTFKSATYLEEVEFDISCNLITVDDDVFYHCYVLRTVYNIPNIINWGNNMFSFCTALTTVTFSPSFNYNKIKNSTFLDCRSLTDITIPTSVTEIKTSAFYRCENLTDITIPALVKIIENTAFHLCSRLEKVIFVKGSNLTTIGTNNVFTSKIVMKGA